MKIALKGNGQLRQRMSWALSQIINVTPTIFPGGNECNMYLYDLYMKNALGNYKDLLREISYNPKMVDMMNTLGSHSVQYQYDMSRKTLWSDENYSCEIMQVYTIGLHKLHQRGLPKLDRHGTIIHTYDTKKILLFAKVWTGFLRGPRRGNYKDKGTVTGS